MNNPAASCRVSNPHPNPLPKRERVLLIPSPSGGGLGWGHSFPEKMGEVLDPVEVDLLPLFVVYTSEKSTWRLGP